MYASQAPGEGAITGQGPLARCIGWLTTNLLVAYLLASAAQRLWAFLHSHVK